MNNLFDTYWLDYFATSEKISGNHKIGVEWEIFGFYQHSNKRINYQTINQILTNIKQNYGWSEIHEENNLIGLYKDEQTITLEPGGQLEFGSSPKLLLADLAIELESFKKMLQSASTGLDIFWLTCGFDPVSNVNQVPLMPKKRYAVMNSYLPQFGEGISQMMFNTCAWQISIDYQSEADMVKKMRAAQILSAIAIAISANSSYKLTKKTTIFDNRVQAWLDSDENRSGILNIAFDSDFGYKKYIEYALKVPLLVLKNKGEIVNVSGRSFLELYQGDIDGIEYNTNHFDEHLRSIFTFTRLKKIIELRVMDSTNIELGIALTLWWKKLLYDQDNLNFYANLALKNGYEYCNHLLIAAVNQGIHCSDLNGNPIIDLVTETMKRVNDSKFDNQLCQYYHKLQEQIKLLQLTPQEFSDPIRSLTETGFSFN